MRKIRTIRCITASGKWHELKIKDKVNGLMVTQILDKSLETPEGMYIAYIAVDENEMLIREYINCPVVVDYFEV